MLHSEADIAHRIGLTPNIITGIGFLLAILAAGAYFLTPQNPLLWLIVAVVLLMASGFCDALDGIIARTYNQASPFGGFLDSLLDRYTDGIVIGGIIIGGASVFLSSTFSIFAGLAALISSFMVSYSRARAEASGVNMEMIGIAERPERILILTVTSLIAIYWLPALTIGLLIIAVLATITVIQRSFHVYHGFRRKTNSVV